MSAYETSIFFAVLMTAILLLLLIAGFIYFMTRQRQRYFHLQRRYFSAQNDAGEAERQRLADTLHDEHNGQLAAIRYGLEDVRPADGESRRHLERVRSLVDAAAAHVRTIAQNLQPLFLEQTGLQPALQAFIRTLPEPFARRVMLQCSVPTPLRNPLLLNVYRILQELLHNALRHSACQRLLLQIKEEKENLHIHYMDDGVGYNTAAATKGRGLNSVRSRVQLLGGSLEVHTRPGEGTRYYMEIPINPAV